MRDLKKLIALLLAMLFLFAVFAAAVSPCNAQVGYIEPTPIEEEAPDPPTLCVDWRRSTRAMTVYVPTDCIAILAEYDVYGRMVRVRSAETVDCRCSFSDDTVGEVIKLFTIGENGVPENPAMDLTSFCAWYQS